MKTMILTIACTVLFIKNTSAQLPETNFKNYIGVGIGYSLDRINDQNFSPLNQKGNTLVYSLFYERHSENILKIALKYGNGNLNSGPKDRFKTSYYFGNIDVSYFKNVSPSQSSTKFYIGGAYTLKVLYMDWFDRDAFSFVSTNGLSISGLISKELNEKQRIESSVSIPFLQLLSRPPYNGVDEHIIENQDNPISIALDGKLTSFKKYKAINWNVNYRYEILDHFDWKADYTLNIQKVDDVNEFKSISNHISTSILYKF